MSSWTAALRRRERTVRLHESEACRCGKSAVRERKILGHWICRLCGRLIAGEGDEIVRPFVPAGRSFGGGGPELSDRKLSSRIDPTAWERAR